MRARPLLALLLLPLLAATALARTGTGPGGYVWKDCEEPDGPTCDYVINADTDGLTGLCSDEHYRIPGAPGFPFPYYGSNFSSLWVSANGVAYLGTPPAADAINAALTGSEGRGTLAPLWDDWAMDNDDELQIVCPDPGCANSGPVTFVESYQTGSGVDASGMQYFDLEWFDTAKHRPTCSEPETATFGMRLYADGRILFNYLDTNVGQPTETDDGVSATIGISRGASGEFTQVSFDTAQIPYVPYAILFIPPCPVLRCNSITAPSDACEGDDVTMRVNFSGGVPPFDVSWDLDGDGSPDAGGNPITQPLPAGVITVTATVTDQCSDPGASRCTSSKVINVHALPVPVVTPQSSTSFCGADGESVTLLADVGYASYQWMRDGSNLAGQTTRTLVANTSGSYVVHVVDAFGCAGDSAPIVVDATDCSAGCARLICDHVDVIPDPACEGRQVTLVAIFSGGEGAVTARWDLDGDTVPDDTGNPLRRVFPAGTNAVTAIIEDTCAPTPQQCSMPVIVRVNPTPSPSILPGGPLTFCAADGESVTLDGGAGWSSWQWLRDGAILPGETAQSIVATSSGSYTVQVSDSAGCLGESLPVVVDATACTTTCAPLTCGNVTVTPQKVCEGDPQDLFLVVSGGEGTVGVAWDVDGDTVPDAVGNPASVTLPAGTHRVHGVAADSCANGPQSCDGFADAIVNPSAASIAEVSSRGGPPLLVLTKAVRLEVEVEPDATAYHAYVDAIGSWWRPSDATGRLCALLPVAAGNRPGTLQLDVPMAVNTWVLITGANPCGEGPAGRSSIGADPTADPGWTACGPAP